jgi:hypothetical protein
MRISNTIALAAATLAVVAVPTTALASNTPDHSDAQKQCRAELKAMGKTTFDKTYGTDKSAFGKCVSHRQEQDTADVSKATKNAAQTCKAQENDPNFAAKNGGKTFAQFYGTNKNGKNAFGKCVSMTAQAAAAKTEASQVKAEENAAKTCRAAQQKDAKAFKTKWGTNHNGANAFGKCVSTTAKGSGSSSGGIGTGAGGY